MTNPELPNRVSSNHAPSSQKPRPFFTEGSRIAGALLTGLILYLGWHPSVVTGQEPASGEKPGKTTGEEKSVKPGINDRFLEPKDDVDRFVKIFEGESREIFTHREALARAVALEPGQAIADIGAGTGLFLDLFSHRAGPKGVVFAVDIAPKFIDHLKDRARKNELTNVRPVLCTDRSTELDVESVDVAFVCDTYHHFEYPKSTLSSLYRALKPGGKLVVVDFERIPGVSREWILGHVRAGKEVFSQEIRDAGFVFVEEIEVDGLEENYVLRFAKPLEDSSRIR